MTPGGPEGPRNRQTRRMAVVGSGLATLAVIGSAGGVLLPGLIGAPRPVLVAQKGSAWGVETVVMVV